MQYVSGAADTLRLPASSAVLQVGDRLAGPRYEVMTAAGLEDGDVVEIGVWVQADIRTYRIRYVTIN